MCREWLSLSDWYRFYLLKYIFCLSYLPSLAFRECSNKASLVFVRFFRIMSIFCIAFWKQVSSLCFNWWFHLTRWGSTPSVFLLWMLRDLLADTPPLTLECKSGKSWTSISDFAFLLSLIVGVFFETISVMKSLLFGENSWDCLELLLGDDWLDLLFYQNC